MGVAAKRSRVAKSVELMTCREQQMHGAELAFERYEAKGSCHVKHTRVQPPAER